jgi:Transposase DDE domain
MAAGQPRPRAGRRHGADPARDHGPKADQRRRTTIYQYKSDRARRSVHGIEQQVAKAEKAVAGQAPIKRNRFVTLSGGTRTVNRELETKARTLAGWKPYLTNIVDADPAWVIGAYHQLWRIEHAFRMSKHDLRARPVYHHKRESIDAHLAVVFAALAISTASKPGPVGRSRNSSAPSAATEPSRSTPAATPWPPKTPRPTTSAKRSPRSTRVRTNLAQLGSAVEVIVARLSEARKHSDT